MEIRRLEKQDLEYANNLRNKYIDYLRQEYPHNLKEQEDWFNSTKNLYWIITGEHKDTLLGIIGLTSIDLKNRKVELSLITNNYLDKEIADFALDFVEKYTFEKLSLHKLFITCYEFDEKKKNYFRNRYHFEFLIRDDVFYQGKYWLHYYYSILENEYRDEIKEK